MIADSGRSAKCYRRFLETLEGAGHELIVWGEETTVESGGVIWR